LPDRNHADNPGMRRLSTLLALVTLAALAATSTAGSVPDDQRLRSVETWAFPLGGGALAKVLDEPGAFDLVVADGEEITAHQVRKLRRHGAIVLGYLSVGTIERYRWWYEAAAPYKLELWDDWGEWYADVSRKGFRDLIASRVAPRMLAKGLHGLFLDNTDMVETHHAESDGMKALVARLARKVHRRGKLLFSQNGDSSIGAMLRYYDGWNREDVTWTYSFDREQYVRVGSAAHDEALAAIRRISGKGLLVTTTDYVPSSSPDAVSQAVAASCAAGAIPYVSNIGLSRVPTPLTC
jgi:uncharacterized protein (TIGR01370 family)